jgi:hypothetical protein
LICNEPCKQLADDEQKLRQLCSDFVDGKIDINDIKNFNFDDEGGRGKRKRFARQDSSSDDEEPLKKLVINFGPPFA